MVKGSTSGHLVVASSSLDAAESHFRNLGFEVYDMKSSSANGHDMTIAKRGETWRVEVKTAVRGNRCWLTKPVVKQRRNDDLIAIVIGNDVIVQPMADHLSCCSKDGSRRITSLVRLSEALRS